MTSHNPNWSGVSKPLPIRIFKRSESIDFLCKRTGQDDENTAGPLADELGDLPLAGQASAYIETTGTAMKEYQELFEDRRKELWEDESPPPDYPLPVGTTWFLAMDCVCKESAEAADLLYLCFFLAPDDILLELIYESAEGIPEPLAIAAADKLAMRCAIRVLRNYSLIDAGGDNLSVHRLVYGDRYPAVATCLNNIGSAWKALGDPKKAIEYFQQAYDIFRNTLGDDHPYTRIVKQMAGCIGCKIGDLGHQASRSIQHLLAPIVQFYAKTVPFFLFCQTP